MPKSVSRAKVRCARVRAQAFRRAGLAAAAALLACGLSATAGAKPLEPAACETLEAEAGQLMTAGAGTDFEKGPAWGAANLTPERLAAVRRLIEVNELLSFRCMRSRIKVTLKPDESEDEAEIPPLPVRPKARPPVPSRAEAASPRTAKAPDAVAQPTRPRTRPNIRPAKAPQRPKANDAYSPAAAAGQAPPLPQPAPAPPAPAPR